MTEKKLVIVRGGGDLATGTAYRLHNAGYNVMILEIEKPTVIRRTVSFAQAIFDEETVVEGVKAVLVDTEEKAYKKLEECFIPVIVDPQGDIIKKIRPDIVVDAILAKKNIGTKKEWAPTVIGLGPGFTAGKDVDAVIETKRGHYLGKVYYQGEAIADTGIPGDIAGYSSERIVRAPGDGVFLPKKKIGDYVNKEDVLGYVEEKPVLAPLTGVLRGIINEGLIVKEGMKIGDIDPRGVKEHCFTISDKARAIGGGVLEAILHLG